LLLQRTLLRSSLGEVQLRSFERNALGAAIAADHL